MERYEGWANPHDWLKHAVFETEEEYEQARYHQETIPDPNRDD